VIFDVDPNEDGLRSKSVIQMIADQDQDEYHLLWVDRLDSYHKHRMILQTSEEPLGGPEEFAQTIQQSDTPQISTTEEQPASFFCTTDLPDTEYGKAIRVEVLTEHTLKERIKSNFQTDGLVDLINERRLTQGDPPLQI